MLSDAKCRKIASILGIQPGESFDWRREIGHGHYELSLRQKFEAIAEIIQE